MHQAHGDVGAPGTTLADEICNWLKDFPPWQQDLARRLAATVTLPADDIDASLNLVRKSFGIVVEGFEDEPQVLQREDLITSSTDSPPRLLAFGDLKGVGLLAENQILRFRRDGLTIIFGQNAAGKSSYVRGLKALCRTVDRDHRVRGNIYSSQSPSPTAQ